MWIKGVATSMSMEEMTYIVGGGLLCTSWVNFFSRNQPWWTRVALRSHTLILKAPFIHYTYLHFIDFSFFLLNFHMYMCMYVNILSLFLYVLTQRMGGRWRRCFMEPLFLVWFDVICKLKPTSGKRQRTPLDFKILLFHKQYLNF